MPSRESMLDYLADNDNIAIRDPIGLRAALSFKALKNFITKIFVRELTQAGIHFGSRVAVILPNGPELAVCIISTLSHWCIVPLSNAYNENELKTEFIQTKAKSVICLSGNQAAIDAAHKLSLEVLFLNFDPDICGLFSVTQAAFNHLNCTQSIDQNCYAHTVKRATSNYMYLPEVKEPIISLDSYSNLGKSLLNQEHALTPLTNRNRNQHREIVMILLTSGTTGTKKVVPYSLDMIVHGVSCVISSWALQPSDLCLNMMPLFHVGGIMRNILAPLFSGRLDFVYWSCCTYEAMRDNQSTLLSSHFLSFPL